MKKASKPRRNYSQKTLKILFALSGNRCAYPDCKNPIIQSATESSGHHVLSQISHIYAISEDGPRGKAGLTEKERNSPDNLVLFCPTHHNSVDGQFETYPADLLKLWKKKHELEMQDRLSADLTSLDPDIIAHPYFPIALVDQRIEDELRTLRRSRFFKDFDGVARTKSLAERLVKRELSGGTDLVRSRALAWCARILCRSEATAIAEKHFALAKKLGDCPEVEVAFAFLQSQKGDKHAALTTLADVDSAEARSAALMVVDHHDGKEEILAWLKSAGLDASSLDPDGKLFLLFRLLEVGNWDAAVETASAVHGRDFLEAPQLNHVVATTLVISVVPTELRTFVLNQIPFEAATFPLASDAASLATRRKAHRLFSEAAEVARKLGFEASAKMDDEFALWLELKDPASASKGRDRLIAKLRDRDSHLRFVPLALQFGIRLDLALVEQEIQQQSALHGGPTYETAMARFSLAFVQRSPEDVAAYISRHIDDLAKFLDKKAMRSVQIQMLAKSGLPGRANELLDCLLEEGLSAVEEGRLRRTIAEAEGNSPIEARMAQFKQTGLIGDLAILVDILQESEEWEGVCEFGSLLFDKTREVPDAERLAIALNNTNRFLDLREFLDANSDFLNLSTILQLLYCWSLYHEGALVAARAELLRFTGDRESPQYRHLYVSLHIALGDWYFLTSFVAEEYQKKDNRSARQLLTAAKLALQLDSPFAKPLTLAATEKSGNDASVLSTAYFLASSAGWEDEPKVAQWLQKAAELSEDDNPIQRMSLKEILDQKPEWDRHESEIWNSLKRGEIPIFLAAQAVNKSLIRLFLFPALSNLLEVDPRRRVGILAFSGGRQATPLKTEWTVGLDATTLLTLSFLDLLDQALDAFNTVYIPHSTLAWLFDEKMKAKFHQPSRIFSAQRVRDLLAQGVLEKFISTAAVDGELATQVGDEIAKFIAEAEQDKGNDKVQHIVVRPSPVYRLSTLMEEEADLRGHSHVLCSCMAIVEKLRQLGHLSAKEHRQASSYLKLHEKPWSNQPEITEGATLYLDDLSITYLLEIGILEKLKPAGFRAYVSPREVAEADEFLAYQRISVRIDDTLESIRSVINSRVKSGRIKVGRRHIGKLEDNSTYAHPTVDLFALTSGCIAIVLDDRCLNRHPFMGDAPEQSRTFTTLDILDALTTAGIITRDEELEYRNRLRSAGYFFIPVREDELAAHLAASVINKSSFRESAELRAIRDSILRVRMSDWLQLPEEELWMNGVLDSFHRVLKSLWIDVSDLTRVRAQSDWILEQIDVRGWAHGVPVEHRIHFIKAARAKSILMLLIPPASMSLEIREEYWNWVEEKVLAPIQKEDPEFFEWIVDRQRIYIAEVSRMEFEENRLSE